MTKEAKNGSWFKRHKILTVILAFVALMVIAGVAGGDKTKTSTASGPKKTNAEKTATKEASLAKLNESARDGKFEFTVSSIECGKISVGTNEYLTKAPQGQFCFLNVSVKNIGDEAQSLFSSNQYLYNQAGQKYSADDTATMYQAPSGTSWYSDINPGNSVTGQIVFDIPKDQVPVKAELHDSALSSGVKISLQ